MVLCFQQTAVDYGVVCFSMLTINYHLWQQSHLHVGVMCFSMPTINYHLWQQSHLHVGVVCFSMPTVNYFFLRLFFSAFCLTLFSDMSLWAADCFWVAVWLSKVSMVKSSCRFSTLAAATLMRMGSPSW